jgi:hypothetical protein
LSYIYLKKTRLEKEDFPPSISIKKSRNHMSRSRKSPNPGLPSLLGRIQTTHSVTAHAGGWCIVIVTRERMRHNKEIFLCDTQK